MKETLSSYGPLIYSALASRLRRSARSAALSPAAGEREENTLATALSLIPLPHWGRGQGEGVRCWRTIRARSLSEKSWPLEKVGSLPHKGSVLRALWRRTRAKLARKWDGRNVACIRLALPRQAPSQMVPGG